MYTTVKPAPGNMKGMGSSPVGDLAVSNLKVVLSPILYSLYVKDCEMYFPKEYCISLEIV
jgi:hypothetical protein